MCENQQQECYQVPVSTVWKEVCNTLEEDVIHVLNKLLIEILEGQKPTMSEIVRTKVQLSGSSYISRYPTPCAKSKFFRGTL